jgi:hypothetical protein
MLAIKTQIDKNLNKGWERMGRLHSKQADAAPHGERTVSEKRKALSKWLMGTTIAASAAIAVSAASSCTTRDENLYIPIPPASTTDGGTTSDGGPTTDGGQTSDGGTTDGGCAAPAPVCNSQYVYGLLNVGEMLLIGDYRVRLADTNEAGGEQRAVVEVLDYCNSVITSQPINENDTVVFQVMGTDIEIEVAVTHVTVSAPKSARITVEMTCTDGGVTDGGVSDGGADGGPADAGPDSDGGAADGGVTDAGPDADGGVADAGPDADGGVSDGGPVDAGPDVDGGAADGGTDGGPACTGVYNESVDNGEFDKNVDVEVGGYYFRYLAYTTTSVTVDIRCGASSADVALGETFGTGIERTIDVPADGKRIRVTLENKNTFRAIMDVSVEDL